jgi:hypothetical protein
MTILKSTITLSFLFAAIVVYGQTKTNLFLKIDTLKAILSKADRLNPFDNSVENIGETIAMVNDEISSRLSDILRSPEILRYNLDSLFEHPFLGKAHSADKRLWIFTWYENTGGSWKSNLSLVHYRTKSNNLKTNYKPISNEDSVAETTSEENEFCSNGAEFHKIYKLKAKNKDLYLCLGSGISCNTCMYETATVVELTKDSINFNYPAFQSKKEDDNSIGNDIQSCFTLDARWEDIEKFQFDSKTQTLNLIYLTDDNTPIQSNPQKRIIRKMVFNGQKFIGNGYN